GLSGPDCEYISQIGFVGMGTNPSSSSQDSKIWIGNNGPNTFTFSNQASVDVILVLWDNGAGDASSFVTANAPKLTYSMPRGSSTTVSLANNVTGAWSAIYGHTTTLAWWGQISNTWGEFTTGQSATVDITRIVNMNGNRFTATVGGEGINYGSTGGCQADHDRCVYVCKTGDTCWKSGTYNLIGCSNQPNNNARLVAGADPSGGCTGWDNGGHIDATFL
ncbi:hypothetical protein B0T17DRAFT_458880, partial [Bombardia bombarda]